MKKKLNYNTVWGKRMKHKTNNILQEVNASIDIDKALYNEDIDASIIHCKMLSKQKIISPKISKKIVSGLNKIRNEIKRKKFKFDKKYEDIHLNIENRLFQVIGSDAGYLHIARSRNDQVTTDFKLWIIKSSKILKENIRYLILELIKLSKKNINIIMPGFTHLKNAQPVLFAHYMLAYVEMFKRDIVKLNNLIKNTSENPLGSGALAGTSLKIDRNFTTKKLNFHKPTSNSMDAVSDRDYALEFMFVCSINAMHLSRFAEEIIIWNSDIAKMISIKDDMLTGSSMMPQKKNPDSAEIVRGKTAIIISNLNSLFIIMKALPLSYFKDMQDDKKLVFECNDNLIKNLKLTKDLVKAIKPNKKKMYEYALNGFTTATDFAEYLVNKGMSFRDAHKKSAQLVNIAEKMNITLNELKFDDIKKVCNQIDKDVMKIFDVSNSVNSKKSFGGTSKVNVIKMLNKSEREMR
ncbi:MAG: argininosuccinate lyase [Candidatus Pelagibacter sp.]|nr:argininosuccinate lyase [Candidatus Pelagibacter sp.]OUV98292.1 MAG: argininosuccinate lyase [Candidatus Pelagibacter sp. TMED142]